MNPEKSGNYVLGLLAISGFLILFCGCRRGSEPRLRLGAFFGSPGGMHFPEPNNLGTHGFNTGIHERNGMVYTCKGGFIDIGHVREAADRTAYLSQISYQNLISKNTDFSFLVVDPSRYRINLSYPSSWDNYTEQQKETFSREASISLGQYLAHSSLIWHEILTGYGFCTSGIFPDTISSFSCEDTYSDLLGIYLGAEALRNRQMDYDDSITQLIHMELQKLDAQPPRVAQHAAKIVDGQWYTGGFYFFVTMKKRNFDVGLDDGFITPVLVDGICAESAARSLAVPSLDLLRQYGLKVNVEIEPRVLENSRICNSIGLDSRTRINPQIHFGLIIEHLELKQNGVEGQHIAHGQ